MRLLELVNTDWRKLCFVEELPKFRTWRVEFCWEIKANANESLCLTLRLHNFVCVLALNKVQTEAVLGTAQLESQENTQSQGSRIPNALCLARFRWRGKNIAANINATRGLIFPLRHIEKVASNSRDYRKKIRLGKKNWPSPPSYGPKSPFCAFLSHKMVVWKSIFFSFLNNNIF